jgi:hypothetical protein
MYNKLYKFLSTYIFIQYILYKSNIINYNPIISFYIGLFIMLILLLFLIYQKTPIPNIIIYCIIIIISKIIPIQTLKFRYHLNDILFSICFFMIYYIVCYVYNVEIIKLYIESINKYKNIKFN